MPKSKRANPWLSLARITLDSNLTPKVFTDCLLQAWKEGESNKGKLHIEKRLATDGKTIFLFMIGNKVAGQFPLEASFLEKPWTVLHTIEFNLARLKEKG